MRHTIRLPEVQAQWWQEVATGLGLNAMLHKRDDDLFVSVLGDEKDVQSAWQLFTEEMRQVVEGTTNETNFN